MNRSDYYDDMKKLARDTRGQYGLDSPRVLKSQLRKIYKDLDIRIDLWPHRLRSVRGRTSTMNWGQPSCSPRVSRTIR